MSLFRITQVSEMPSGASAVWQGIYRAILGALQGLWGVYDVDVTGTTSFKSQRMGRMAWASIDGNGSATITLPFSFDGNVVSSINNGTATISGSTLTVSASGDWSLAIYGRITEV